MDALELTPLELSDLRTLAERILGGRLLPSLLEQLRARTAGNPLLVIETLRLWVQEQALVRTGGAFGPRDPDLPAPATLIEASERSWARLLEDQRLIAEVLAVADRRVSFAELSTLTRFSQPNLAEHIEALAAANILEGNPHSGYTLANEVFRTVVLRHLPATTAATISERIVEEARERGDVREAAHHARKALLPPEDLADLLYTGAASEMTAGALARAVELDEAFIEIAPADPRLPEVKLRRAEAIAKLDRARSVRAFDEAVDAQVDTRDKARALLGLGKARASLGDFQGAEDALQRCVAYSPPGLVDEARRAMAVVMLRDGREKEAETTLQELVDGGDANAAGVLANILFSRGELLRAVGLVERALPSARSAQERAFLRSNLCNLQLLLGDLDEAERIAIEGLEDSAREGLLIFRLRFTINVSEVARLRGAIDTALDGVLKIEREAMPLGGLLVAAEAAWLAARVQLDTDDPAGARDTIERFLDANGSSFTDADRAVIDITLAEALIGTGELKRARETAQRAYAALNSVPAWALQTDRALAMVYLAVGNPRGAARLAQKWLDEPSDLVLEQARMEEVAAQALHASNKPREARAAAERALERYQTIGVNLRAQIVERWLNENVGRRPPPAPFGLTPREAEIMELAASGMTNAEIAEHLTLSVGTVKKHMERVLVKTGAERRAELANLRPPEDSR